MKAGRNARLQSERGVASDSPGVEYIEVSCGFANASRLETVKNVIQSLSRKTAASSLDFDAFRSWPEATKMICLLRTGRVAQLVRARP